MRMLIVHPGADTSVSDVHDGLVPALQCRGAEIVSYALNGRLAVAGSYLHYLYRRQKRLGQEAERPNDGDMVYWANQGILERALRFQPDVILIISSMFIPPDTVLLLRRAGFFVATLFTESPYDDIVQARIAALSNVCWTNERDSVAELREANPNVFYLRHAYDPVRHFVKDDDPADVPSHDVVFVGTGFQERFEMLSGVNWDGINFGLYGNWPMGSRSKLRKHLTDEVVPNERTAALYRRAKIGLNLHRKSFGFGRYSMRIVKASSLNPRAYELAACGCFTITDYREEVGEVFGDVLPTFKTPKELEAQIRRYVADDGERARISGKLPGLVAGETFDARAGQVLEDINRVRHVDSDTQRRVLCRDIMAKEADFICPAEVPALLVR